MLSILFLSTVTTAPGHAQNSKPSCDEIVNACEKTIADADKIISILDGRLRVQGELLEHRKSQIEALEQDVIDLSNPPWYADYKVTFLIGFITAGGIIYGIGK